MHIYYSSLIINIFNEYKNKINLLNNSHIFHNSIRKILDKLQNNKRQYFKNIANEFSNNYDFHFFNTSYDIGENVRLFMEKEYNDIKFNYVYDYVELFENYTDSYIKRIISNITKMEKDITDKFDNIYNKFLNNYKDNISIFINNDFVNELNNNFTLCLDYSYDLLKEKKNIYKYNNLVVLINSTYLYCQNKYEKHDVPINEKIEF
jgi:mRNA-degrading endonuclease RelE of RelBE toxin-antitoxin system